MNTNIKPKYINPFDMMKLEAARGIDGTAFRPSVDVYNAEIKKPWNFHQRGTDSGKSINGLVGTAISEKLLNSPNSLTVDPAQSPEVIKETVTISQNAVNEISKKLTNKAKAGAPKRKDNVRTKAKQKSDNEMVKKTQQVAKRVRAEVSGVSVKQKAVIKKPAAKSAPVKAIKAKAKTSAKSNKQVTKKATKNSK